MELYAIVVAGKIPFSVDVGVGWYVEQPTLGPDWQLRMTFTVSLPVAQEEKGR